MVFVNLAIGSSTIRVEDYVSTNKKNKEILKVSFNQEEDHVVQSTGYTATFLEKIATIESILLLGLAVGTILCLFSKRVFLNSKKLNKKIKKIVSRETFFFKRAFSKVKKSYYLGISFIKAPYPHS